MAARHGTRAWYKAACRCDECRRAQASYQARYRQRVVDGETRPCLSSPPVAPELQESKSQIGPSGVAGRVESAVVVELAGLALAEERPGVAAAAVAMGRVLDSRGDSSKPSAARVLTRLLDELHKGSDLRKSRLSVVRTMTGPSSTDSS